MSRPLEIQMKKRISVMICICLASAVSYSTAASTDDEQLRKEYDELKRTVQQLNEKLSSLEGKAGRKIVSCDFGA